MSDLKEKEQKHLRWMLQLKKKIRDLGGTVPDPLTNDNPKTYGDTLLAILGGLEGRVFRIAKDSHGAKFEGNEGKPFTLWFDGLSYSFYATREEAYEAAEELVQVAEQAVQGAARELEHAQEELDATSRSLKLL